MNKQVTIRDIETLNRLSEDPKCEACYASILTCLQDHAGKTVEVAHLAPSRIRSMGMKYTVRLSFQLGGRTRPGWTWNVCEHVIAELTGLALAAEDPKAYMAAIRKLTKKEE